MTPEDSTAVRVALVTTQWGPPWNEGVRNIARCIVAFFEQKGAKVSIIAPPPRRETGAGRTVRIPLLRAFLFSLSAARRTRRTDADVVLFIASLSPVLGLRSWLLRRWTGKRLLIYVTGQRRFTGGYRRLLRADAVLVGSPALARFFPDAEMVPPATDPRRWRPVVRTAPPARPVILFLGAFERCRGVEYLIRAMEYLPNELGATLRLAWNGVGRDRHAAILRSVRATTAASRIEILESADVARLYAEAAVVVIPRIAPERMAFPVRIVEAVNMGVPLIVTRVNRMDELVDGCGLAVPPRDAPALAAAIARLLTDPALYVRLAAGCLEKARAWDPARTLETVYAAALRCR